MSGMYPGLAPNPYNGFRCESMGLAGVPRIFDEAQLADGDVAQTCAEATERREGCT